MSKITEEIETIVTPILDDLNFELVDVEYAKEGKNRLLRISTSKEGGVDLNDCTLASEKISGAMDQNDPVPEICYFDIASPEAERLLKKKEDYQNAVEQPVFVFLYAPIEGDKEWLDILKSVGDDTIIMEVRKKSEKKTVRVPRNKIAKTCYAVMI